MAKKIQSNICGMVIPRFRATASTDFACRSCSPMNQTQLNVPRALPDEDRPQRSGGTLLSWEASDHVDLCRNVGVALAQGEEGADHLGGPGALDLRVRQRLEPITAEES